MEYFPDYASETHDRNCGNVTIENLLTMTVPYAFEEWKEPLEQLCTDVYKRQHRWRAGRFMCW